VNFVQATANVLSAAILRERDQKEIHRLVTTDDLTGMANRREFDRALNHAVKQVERYGRPASLVMYDLDHFKQVNDSFGHETGDRVLRSISELVRANVRELDILARWGGEEFMILASETTADTAAAMAEKLRGLIAAQVFEQVGMMVTASFGVTELTKGDSPTAVVSRVDEALYQAKQGGRNRVHVVRAADTGS
jgi:diguanylate cyclase (GGDEF)-like protein